MIGLTPLPLRRCASSSWRFFLLPLVVLVGCVSPGDRPASGGRVTLNFNPDWRFIKADPAGAQNPSFDDTAWTTVSAPHTFNDVDTFDNWSVPGHRGEQEQWSGRTWYRKTFTLPAAYQGKKVFIEFEAVRQIAEVYLNGQLLGVHKTGFTPFGFDLTPHLRFDGPNLLAVMVDNRYMRDPLDPKTAAELAAKGVPTTGLQSAANPNLSQLHTKINETIPENLEDLQADQIPWNNPHWHPAHGGLYRNVKLHVVDPLHIPLPLYSFLQTAGVYVYATDITEKSAQVTVEVPVKNERATAENIALRTEIRDASGRSILVLEQNQTVAAGASAQFKVSGAVANPRLWEPAYPHLYRAINSLHVNGQAVDTTDVDFGIRTVRWDTLTGFYINGQHLKLRGWGQKPTDEWPGLGAAHPDWMHFYTMKLMKDAGGNFVRWGHCAGGPASIFAGDRLGIIADQPGVEGEHDTVGAAWKLRVQAFRDTIVYFRNSPSILIWEGGNQKVSREHARELRGYMDQFDPHGQRAYAHRRADQITAEFMDVGIGTEGGREIARLPVVEGEYNREESPRRVWDDYSPPSFGYPEAKGQTYQLTSEQFAVKQVEHWVKKIGAPEHAGGANWIFSDSTSGGRVAVEVARASGEVDGVRLPKEAYFATAAMFRDEPQVHIIGHWTYPAKPMKKNVYVVSNAESVELTVNGKSAGPAKVTDKYLFTFADVEWEPGELKAVASRGGKVVATQSKRTAGEPVALRLTPMTGPGGLLADGSDVVLIDVEAVDANGNRCPTFQQRVDFETEGPGTWRGGYNSGKINSVNNPFLDLEAGINRVAVRAGRTPGTIKVRARTEGLKPGSVSVISKPVAITQGYAFATPAMPSVALPATAPVRVGLVAAATSSGTSAKGPAMAGRFTKSISYSGPSNYIVHLEILARDGKNAYVDVDSPFANLPAELVGADWIQAAQKESLFHAVDLMEIAVNPGTVVSIAHDDRLPRPPWLTQQFQPTELTVTVSGQAMKIFQRPMPNGGSLTLGANTEDLSIRTANMYLVFVNAAK